MFFVRTGDGVKIAVYDLNPRGKQTVFLVHGWPLSHKMYEYQTELLTSLGYRVVLLDLRGFGNSDAPSCRYGYSQMADDIYTVVRALRLHHFILVGFSMGGGIVTRYMARHNGYGVKKLVLLGAATPSLVKRPDFPYGVSPESVEQWAQQTITDRAQLNENFSRMLLYSSHSNAIVNWFRSLADEASGIGTLQTAYALGTEDMREDIQKIKVPTGIFHGVKDRVVPFELALVQKECIRNSTLFPMEYSGHGVFYDELSKFNRLFLEYIQEDC